MQLLSADGGLTIPDLPQPVCELVWYENRHNKLFWFVCMFVRVLFLFSVVFWADLNEKHTMCN